MKFPNSKKKIPNQFDYHLNTSPKWSKSTQTHENHKNEENHREKQNKIYELSIMMKSDEPIWFHQNRLIGKNVTTVADETLKSQWTIKAN